jgi:uncharacterized protein (TIGR02996 family)
MAEWRFEPARTGRSTCQVCFKAIKAGEVRFGQDGVTATWYHLDCAAKGKPIAFKPFAARAAEIKKLGWNQTGPKAAAKKAPRNAALEKALVAAPTDEKPRLVYSDWLQAQGDPWGEIIALACAGKRKQAATLLGVHEVDLTADLGAHREVSLDWYRGFLSRVVIKPKKQSGALQLMSEVFELRTALLLEELSLDLSLSPQVVDLVSARAPRSLRTLSLRVGEGLGALAHPGLRELSLIVEREGELSELARLGGKRLPALRCLEVYSSPALSLPALNAVLASPVLQGLRMLNLTYLSDPAVRAMLAKPEAVAHIPAIWFEGQTSRWTKPIKAAFGPQLKAHLAIEPNERDYDFD